MYIFMLTFCFQPVVDVFTDHLFFPHLSQILFIVSDKVPLIFQLIKAVR